MISVTHALTTNGRIHSELKDPDASPQEMICRSLMTLDGARWFSEILWALPDGERLEDIDLDRWPQEYVQAAGSRDRMTVEIRRSENGIPRQYVVGRGKHARKGWRNSREVISWDGIETRVSADEVFDADAAADLFIAYYNTGTVPDGFNLRLLDL